MDTILGRVTKARILQAVREAKGRARAERIEHLKKGDMATEAEALLAGSGWLPEPLRTPGRASASLESPEDDERRPTIRRRRRRSRRRTGRGRTERCERG